MPNRTAASKITKPVRFERELQLRAKRGLARYRLVAVVRHFGETTHSGHYTADVRLATGSGDAWLRCNDAAVGWLPRLRDLFEAETPYLLFYEVDKGPRHRE